MVKIKNKKKTRFFHEAVSALDSKKKQRLLTLDASQEGTLSKEYKSRGKSNSFIDKRKISGNEESENFERLIKGRVRVSKKHTRFNLDEGMTYGGDDRLGAELVRDIEKTQTKNKIVKKKRNTRDIYAKFKAKKYERQIESKNKMNITNELDKDFKELMNGSLLKKEKVKSLSKNYTGDEISEKYDTIARVILQKEATTSVPVGENTPKTFDTAIENGGIKVLRRSKVKMADDKIFGKLNKPGEKKLLIKILQPDQEDKVKEDIEVDLETNTNDISSEAAMDVDEPPESEDIKEKEVSDKKIDIKRPFGNLNIKAEFHNMIQETNLEKIDKFMLNILSKLKKTKFEHFPKDFYEIVLQHYISMCQQRPVIIPLIRNWAKYLRLLFVYYKNTADILFETCLLDICSKSNKKSLKNAEHIIKNNKAKDYALSNSFLLYLCFEVFLEKKGKWQKIVSKAIDICCSRLSNYSTSEQPGITRGIFLSALLVAACKSLDMYIPQPISFCLSVLQTIFKSDKEFPSAINFGSYQYSTNKVLNMKDLVEYDINEKLWDDNDFKSKVINTTLEMIKGIYQCYSSSNSFPEIFAPILQTLESAALNKDLPQELGDNINNLINTLKIRADETSKSRKPLRRKENILENMNEELVPEFDDGQEEREKLEIKKKFKQMKQLKKKVKQEAKRLSKDIRKDAVFMSNIRDKEKSKVDEERLKNQKEFYKELNVFEQNMRDGGQKGMNPHLDKKRKRISKY